MGTMDGILDTVSASHPLLPLIGLLKFQGKLIMLGVPNRPLELPVFPLAVGKPNKSIFTSIFFFIFIIETEPFCLLLLFETLHHVISS